MASTTATATTGLTVFTLRKGLNRLSCLKSLTFLASPASSFQLFPSLIVECAQCASV